MELLGQPSFRAKQLAQWLYVHHVNSYENMTNLPVSLRESLSERFPLHPATLAERRISHDGTRKYIVEFHDGACVEAVAIPSKIDNRLTICFSTQVGCSMQCAFCATGKAGFERNLLPGEIVDQVMLAQEDMGQRVTNLVGMGQGEPFLNYENVLSALRILNYSKGIAIGARHISISTCGLLDGIERFSHEPEQFTLAVSLHAARQATRDLLMPRMATNQLPDLQRALRRYTQKTNRRVTLEYIMIQDVNDTEDDLEALQAFCSDLLCHINLIPINVLEDSSFRPSEPRIMRRWIESIQSCGKEITVRNSRGADIEGACGQLKRTKCFT
ncbi:23S rRNA (adenine(2503)-C(2))-methyltransferase RlmN [Gordonibacter sp. An230]